jgi:hydrogenase maturation protein HypF
VIAPAARLVRVTGQVQGVGFRPFVHRLAIRHHLAGWVRNASGEVQIEIEGPADELDGFLSEMVAEAPPLAAIDAVEVTEESATGYLEFAILASIVEPERRLAPPPDAAICPACEAELFEVGNRRHQYPFVTCTDCGPRYTVIEEMPYDRQRTSMAAFSQCPSCLAEYHTPGDRRYHSESNSCPSCGPALWFEDRHGALAGDTAAAIEEAGVLLLAGGIVALRSLGGFHLAVDATNAAAVERLRVRKHRESKPLAVMVRTLDEARRAATLTEIEAALLESRIRPIVLLPKTGDLLAPGVAPGLTDVGLMLASTPLHHLLLARVRRPLVMTSGNETDEPIAIGNAEARVRLAAVADGFLFHDREVVARYDDSVLRVVDDAPVLIRRARGYAPAPIRLPVASPLPLVAVGAHLKSTLTLVDGSRAYVSQHIGDLENLETLDHFQSTLASYRRLFRLEPAIVARDLHPGYLSTRVATEMGLPSIAVQHHHAHIAAVLAEHGETDEAIGVAFDGTGHGADGLTWGAEFLIADLIDYRRVAHFGTVALPGGDLAARTPWRSALAYAVPAGLVDAWRSVFAPVDPTELALATRQIIGALNAPLVSSMGRLFDAAAAIIGIRHTASHEAQAAMELEALAGHRPASEIASEVTEQDGVLIVDPTRLLATLARRRERGADPADLAADFHASVAWITERIVRRLAEQTGRSTVALGGGVFQNARLLSSVRGRLTAAGLRVLIPRRLSPNDGAVSYGQAAVAAARLARFGPAAAA